MAIFLMKQKMNWKQKNQRISKKKGNCIIKEVNRLQEHASVKQKPLQIQ